MFTKAVLAVATAAALVVPSFIFAQVSAAERLAPGQPPVVVARAKAVEGGYPELSLAGFQWAIDRGVDVVVIGVQRTADDQYIVMKDPSLTRTTNVREVYPDGPPRRDPGDMVARWHLVSDYTLEEIRKIRLVDQRGGSHPVPTLDEALDLIDGRILAALRLDIYKVDSLAALLATHDTENLLLFTWEDEKELHEVIATTGINAWDSLVELLDPVEALEKLVDRYGPTLKVVDVEVHQLTSDLAMRAADLGVRLSLDPSVEDTALAAGETAPWLKTLDSAAGVFMTYYPGTVLQLMGR